MEILEICKMSKVELIARNIIHINGDQSINSEIKIYNPFNLKIYKQEYGFYVSENEVELLLAKTKYFIVIKASFMEGNEPLHDRHGNLHDVLINCNLLGVSISEVIIGKRYNHLSMDKTKFTTEN